MKIFQRNLLFKLSITLFYLWVGGAHSVTSSHAGPPSVQVILVPQVKMGAASVAIFLGELQKIRYLKVRYIFTPKEQDALRRLDEPELAHSLKAEVKDRDLIKTLRAWLKSRSHLWEVQENAKVRLMTTAPQSGASAKMSEPFENQQWALNNRGESQPLFKNERIVGVSPGKVGEDLGLKNAKGVRESGQEVSGKKPVVVAVLDSGVDRDHPDLETQVLKKAGECEALKKYLDCLKYPPIDLVSCEKNEKLVDTDGNGYPLDCAGWNFSEAGEFIEKIPGDYNSLDDGGHGTHVAGIIAAAANGKGILGVAPRALILPIKVYPGNPNNPFSPKSDLRAGPLSSQGGSEAPSSRSTLNVNEHVTFADVIARGVLYAIESKVKVDILNLSMNWPKVKDTTLVKRMIERAQKEKILVVASSGNDSTEVMTSPCSYPGVICVGAHGPDGKLSYFSNFGSATEILAPGQSILSTWPIAYNADHIDTHPGYDLKDGTSMAAPAVAGVLARFLELGYSAVEARARLFLGARENDGAIFGNTDFAKGLEIAEQALILPGKKVPMEVHWNRLAMRIPIKFELQNFWKKGRGIEIRARLLGEGRQAVDVQLSKSFWSVKSWPEYHGIGERFGEKPHGENLVFETELVLKGKKISRVLFLELEISGPAQTRVIKPSIPILLGTKIGKEGLTPEEIKKSGGIIIPLKNWKVPLGASIFPVIQSDGKTLEEYMVLQKIAAEENSPSGADVSSPKLNLSLLSNKYSPERVDASYEVMAEGSVDLQKSEPMAFQRIPYRLDGEDFYSLISVERDLEAETLIYGFHIFDAKLKIVSEFKHINSIQTAILKEYLWMAVKNPQGGIQLVPAWINDGPVPQADRKYSYWHSGSSNIYTQKTYRLFYLDAEAPHALRAIDAPKDHFFISFMPQSVKDQTTGEIPLLLGSAKDYKSKHFVTSIRNGVWEEFHELQQNQFRNLFFTSTHIPAQLLSALNSQQSWPSPQRPPFALGAGGLSGGYLLSFLFSQDSSKSESIESLPASPPSPYIQDFSFSPQREFDSIQRAVGAFWGHDHFSTFTQSHFDLLYHDLTQGSLASLSLNRYTFISENIFTFTLIPVVVKNLNPGVLGGNHFPGVFVLSKGVNEFAPEVVIPKYDSTGKLDGLMRPALLTFDYTEGCVNVEGQLPWPITDGIAPRAVFFCEDQMIQMPYEF